MRIINIDTSRLPALWRNSSCRGLGNVNGLEGVVNYSLLTQESTGISRGAVEHTGRALRI
jgi:hypothetical protein